MQLSRAISSQLKSNGNNSIYWHFILLSTALATLIVLLEFIDPQCKRQHQAPVCFVYSSFKRFTSGCSLNRFLLQAKLFTKCEYTALDQTNSDQHVDTRALEKPSLHGHETQNTLLSTRLVATSIVGMLPAGNWKLPLGQLTPPRSCRRINSKGVSIGPAIKIQ